MQVFYMQRMTYLATVHLAYAGLYPKSHGLGPKASRLSQRSHRHRLSSRNQRQSEVAYELLSITQVA